MPETPDPLALAAVPDAIWTTRSAWFAGRGGRCGRTTARHGAVLWCQRSEKTLLILVQIPFRAATAFRFLLKGGGVVV